MKKGNLYINLVLDSPQCTMISPGYRYEEKFGSHQKKEWNPDTLQKLEKTISITMKDRHQKELAETLEETTPSIYINCGNKENDDIMFYILKQYIQQSKAKNKQELVFKTIGRHTIITESREQRIKYINEKQPSITQALQHYSKLLNILLEKHPEKDSLLNMESDIMYNGFTELMEDEGIHNIYLYLDNITSLSYGEQQRINTLLYTRGAIGDFGNKRIRLKINNGNGLWKTRKTISDQRVESTHDYLEVNIYENQLK